MTKVADEEIRQKELEEIKKQYLGGNKPQKRRIKHMESFNADDIKWDDGDDTTRQAVPSASLIVDFRPAFGTGYIGGIDHSFQDHIHEKTKSSIKQILPHIASSVINPLNPDSVSSASPFVSSTPLVNAGSLSPRMMADREEAIKERETDRETRRRAKAALELEQRIANSKHWSEKELEDMTERDWRIFKEDFNITTRGGSIPSPIRKWNEAKISGWILEALQKNNFEKPTPIQMAAISIGLENRDLVGIAETGSGKTLAFVIPMLVYIHKMPRLTPETEVDGPYALIMAPTRELALQIQEETNKIAKFANYRTVALVGGQSVEEQAFLLRRGCEIIIGTPGRLLDCIERRYVVLNQCNYVVMDEADRMIDLGFEAQVNSVLQAMKSDTLKSEDENVAQLQEKNVDGRIYRTTIMFSATMPPGVERLSRNYLRRPAYVAIGEAGKSVDRIVQRVEFVHSEGEKRQRIIDLVFETDPPIIIFVNKKRTCDSLKKILESERLSVTTLHSGKSQDQREKNFELFKKGNCDILIATDVACRGLDVKAVQHVINYDMTADIRNYTHRIGRTGRAGLDGLATTFISNEDEAVFYDLKQFLQKSKAAIPEELRRHPAAQFRPVNIGGPSSSSSSSSSSSLLPPVPGKRPTLD